MTNYLIGFGERLTQPIEIRRGMGEKAHPYTFATAKERLAPQIKQTLHSVAELPKQACPDDEAVIAMALHPAYLAKSYFPGDLLKDAGLRAVGSRAVSIEPDEPMKVRGRKRVLRDVDSSVDQHTAPELFIAGPRRSLQTLRELVGNRSPRASVAEDFRKIEQVRPLSEDRVRPISGDDKLVPIEVVLHASSDGSEDYIIDGFRVWAAALGLKINLEARIQVGGALLSFHDQPTRTRV